MVLSFFRRACKRQSSSTRHSQGQIAVVCPWLAKLPREEEARAEAHAFRVKVSRSSIREIRPAPTRLRIVGRTRRTPAGAQAHLACRSVLSRANVVQSPTPSRAHT